MAFILVNVKLWANESCWAVRRRWLHPAQSVSRGRETGFFRLFYWNGKRVSQQRDWICASICRGDLVALHVHQTWPGNEEYVTMDFFRFDENGKIIEYWDSYRKFRMKLRTVILCIDSHIYQELIKLTFFSSLKYAFNVRYAAKIVQINV